jgi:hypothetical protein
MIDAIGGRGIKSANGIAKALSGAGIIPLMGPSDTEGEGLCLNRKFSRIRTTCDKPHCSGRDLDDRVLCGPVRIYDKAVEHELSCMENCPRPRPVPRRERISTQDSFFAISRCSRKCGNVWAVQDLRSGLSPLRAYSLKRATASSCA